MTIPSLQGRSLPPHSTAQSLLARFAALAGSVLLAGGGLLWGAVWLAGLAAWQPASAFATAGPTGVFTDTTTADFSAGCATNLGAHVSPASGGELRLTATLADYFDAASVNPALWLTAQANLPGEPFLGGTPVISNSLLVLENTAVRSQAVFTASPSVRFFESRARLQVTTAPGWPDLGYGRELRPGYPITDSTAIRLFISQDTTSSGGGFPALLFVRARDGGPGQPLIDLDIDPDPDLTQYHDYRLEWDTTETRWYVDGVLRQTTLTNTTALTTYVWLLGQDSGRPAWYDWVRAGQYAPTATWTSCVEDAGGIVNWSTLTAAQSTPDGTAVAIRTRTSLDNTTWSDWSAPLTSTLITSPSGRYFQYQVDLSTSTMLRSPELQSVVVNYYGVDTVRVAPAPATVDPGASQQFTVQAYDINNAPINSLTYTWGSGLGGVLNASGLYTAGLPSGLFVNGVSATVQTTSGPVVGSANVTVRDLPPVANPGGPYAVNETGAISLTASATDPNLGGAISFAWDLDNNGSFEQAGSPINSVWPDSGQYPVTLRSTDSPNGITSTVVVTVFVNNLPPSISAVSNNGPVNEASPAAVTITATDPAGVYDPLTYALDCNNDNTFEVVGGSTLNCTFSDNGSYPVNVRVTDGDGGVANSSTTILVTNVAPSISLVGNSGPILEGGSAAITVTASDVAGGSDPLQYSFDCNNDSTYEVGPQAGNNTNCLFADNGAFTVNVRVIDGDGGTATSNTTVTVTNVAPTLSATGVASIAEGQAYTLTLAATDPGADTISQWVINWGDGVTTTVTGAATSPVPHTYWDGPSFYNIFVSATDEDGTYNTTRFVTVVNTAPVINAVATPLVITQTQVVTLTVTATDVPTDTLTYQWDLDNNGSYETLGQTVTTTLSAIGVYTFTARVSDEDGGVALDPVTVTFGDGPPEVEAGGVYQGNEGSVITFTATGSDFGDLTGATLTYQWFLGASLTPFANGRVVTTTFAQDGVYSVTVRATDTGNNTASDVAQVLIANVAPTANAGADGAVAEGTPLPLNGSATDPGGLDVLTYEWDLNYDGVTFTPDVVGTLSTSLTVADGPVTRVVALRVRDGNGGEAIDTRTVTVTNAAPAISAVTNSGPVQVGFNVLITVTATDAAGPNDTLQYAFDCDNNGVYEIGPQAGASTTCLMSTWGSRVVSVRVTDEDGGQSVSTTTVTVNPYRVYLPMVVRP